MRSNVVSLPVVNPRHAIPLKLPRSTKPGVVTKKVAKVKVPQATQDTITSLPYEEGSFRFIRCDRKKATNIQQWLYRLNKDNAIGAVYATRFNYKKGGLLVWRMA